MNLWLIIVVINKTRVVVKLGSISAALSSLVCVPPREELRGRSAARTAAGDRAYCEIKA